MSPEIEVVPSASFVAFIVERVRLVKLLARSRTSSGFDPAGKLYRSSAVRVVAVISALTVPGSWVTDEAVPETDPSPTW